MKKKIGGIIFVLFFIVAHPLPVASESNAMKSIRDFVFPNMKRLLTAILGNLHISLRTKSLPHGEKVPRTPKIAAVTPPPPP